MGSSGVNIHADDDPEEPRDLRHYLPIPSHITAWMSRREEARAAQSVC